MNTIHFSRSKTVALLCILMLVLAACKPASASDAAAQTSVPKILQYSGSGISVNAYDAVLKAGIARFHVTADGALTIDVSGPDGFNSQVLHLGQQSETVSEIQIPADGTYTISIDHAGLGSWKVVVDMSGAASNPVIVPSATLELAAAPTTEPPAATSEPVQPAAGFQFTGSGVSVNTYAAVLPAGTARFRIITDSPMTIVISGPDNFFVEVLHTGVPSETTHEVQIPADGTYGLAVQHSGAGSWAVVVESLGGAPSQPTVESATATPEPTSLPPASLTYKGSGTSVHTYQAVLRAGNAKFVVSASGVLTVDIDGPNDFSAEVLHTGGVLVTTSNVQIPADGTYTFTISHVGSLTWKIIVTQ